MEKIISIPFWVDSDLWFPMEDKNQLREDLGFSEDDYLIGSFQRDKQCFPSRHIHTPREPVIPELG